MNQNAGCFSWQKRMGTLQSPVGPFARVARTKRAFASVTKKNDHVRNAFHGNMMAMYVMCTKKEPVYCDFALACFIVPVAAPTLYSY